MSDSPESLRCPGMRDLHGDELVALRAVEERFSQVARGWGFEEVRTPLIEHLYLYTQAGTLTPQLLGRIYSFLDWDGWSGERVVLRPDSTVAVARLYSEHFDGEPARLFYTQPVLRFAPGDEQRQSWQAGAEMLGEGWAQAEAQLLAMAVEVLETLSVPDVSVAISHSDLVRRVLGEMGRESQAQTALYDRILDGDVSAVAEIEAALPQLSTGLRLLFNVEGENAEYLRSLRAGLQPALPGLEIALDELDALAAALEALGARFTVVTPLARDFEYYTGLVFQIRSGSQVLGAGGRYDQLVGQIAGRSAPACGFALASEVVATLAPTSEPSETAVPVVANQPNDVGNGLKLVRLLRERGVSAVLATESQNGRSVTVSAGSYLAAGETLPAGEKSVERLLALLNEKRR